MRNLSIEILVATVIVAATGCNVRRVESNNTARMAALHEDTKVDVMRIEETMFSRQIIANGKALASERADLHFRTEGVIAAVNVQNGSLVKKGAELASLDSSEKKLALKSARHDLERAELDLYNVLAGQGYSVGDTSSVDESVLHMAKMRSGWISARNAVERAESDMENVSLKAPFSGKIANVMLQRFDRTGSSAFCTVINDNRMYVDFAILESEYALVHKGLKVKLSSFAQPSEILIGEVVSVNPLVDRNGQVSVRAAVSNNGSLIDGMNVKITVEKNVGEMLVVPRSAVVIRDNMDVLFRYSEGKAIWTYVNILMSNGDSFAVEANKERGASLSPGDTVIISNNLNLADGSRIVIRQ